MTILADNGEKLKNPMQDTQKKSDLLYHYTTWEGLHGILKYNNLWATHCRYLNDYTEIVFFKDKLIDLLKKDVHQAFLKLPPEQLDAPIKESVKVLYEELGKQLYITSFCNPHEDPYINENGLLSQWRGYGTDGGFALVLNEHKLKEILLLEFDKFNQIGLTAEVIYGDDEQKINSELATPVQELAEYIINTTSKVNQQGSLRDVIASEEIAIRAFLGCATRCKHQGFKEEKEARIVAWPFPNNVPKKLQKEIKLRSNKNGEHVPYIELFGAPEMPLPIEKIIVGPHSKKEARTHALRTFLKNHQQYKNIDVDFSDIPYVC